MTKFLSTAKLRVFRMLRAHDVDVRTVGFAVSFKSKASPTTGTLPI